VCSPEKVLESPQLKSRGFFVEVGHPEIGTSIQYSGAPYKFDGCSLDRWERAPLIGEDNVQIYQKELGLTENELQELSAMGVI